MRTADLDAALADADPAATTAAELTRLDRRARDDLDAILASADAGGPSAAAAPAPSHLPRRRLLVLAVAVAVITASGTAIALTRGEDPPATSAGAPAPDAKTLLDALDSSASGSAGAAVLLNTPAELAAEVDIVAIGRFVRFQSGRTTTNLVLPGVTSTSTVMVLDDVRLAQGRLPDGGDGNLYVQLRVGGAEESVPQEVADAIPVGTQVLVYAADVSDPSPEVTTANPDAGRPQGQRPYMVQHVQGFALQAADDVVVWPQLRVSLPGTLAQALPDGDLIWTP